MKRVQKQIIPVEINETCMRMYSPAYYSIAKRVYKWHRSMMTTSILF